jgi:hypothetical protein
VAENGNSFVLITASKDQIFLLQFFAYCEASLPF